MSRDSNLINGQIKPEIGYHTRKDMQCQGYAKESASYDACTPVEYYFKRTEKLDLKAFAITDHNIFDALQEIRKNSF